MSSGGAVYSSETDALVMETCRVVNNFSAPVCLVPVASVVVTDCVFEENEGWDAGAALIAGDSTLTVSLLLNPRPLAV